MAIGPSGWIDWAKRLQESGHLPKNLYRVVIDLKMNDAVKVYCATYAEEDILGDDLLELVQTGKDVVPDVITEQVE